MPDPAIATGNTTQKVDGAAWKKLFYTSRGALNNMPTQKQNALMLKFKKNQHKRHSEEDSGKHNCMALSQPQALVVSAPKKSVASKSRAMVRKSKSKNQNGTKKNYSNNSPPPRDWNKWFADNSHTIISYSEAELPAIGLVTAKNIYLLMRVKAHAPGKPFYKMYV